MVCFIYVKFRKNYPKNQHKIMVPYKFGPYKYEIRGLLQKYLITMKLYCICEAKSD